MNTDDRLQQDSATDNLAMCASCDKTGTEDDDESACSRCGMRDSCEKTATLDSIRAADEFGSTKMSLFSLLVFIFPLLGAVIGAVLGSRFGVNGEVIGAVLGFAAFVLIGAVSVKYLSVQQDNAP